MPELPEVEVTRQSFAGRIDGARVVGARVGKPLRWALGCEPQALVGLTVGEVTRRGKYLWLPLQTGGLLMHLGMSGSLAFAEGVADPGPHDHFDLVTTRGTLRLTDPRRFGAVVWSQGIAHDPAARLLAGLGMEPFDPAFTGAHMHAALRGRRVAIKQVLLVGDVVVGAGNIYACEALFVAGIDPHTRSWRISKPRCDRLAAALQQILSRAVALGGTTLRDFRDTHGMAGAFQLHAGVYGREGLPCPRCDAPVRRVVQGQRATFFCPVCQRR